MKNQQLKMIQAEIDDWNFKYWYAHMSNKLAETIIPLKDSLVNIDKFLDERR